MVGEGILKGLAETARNFFGSYVSKDRLTTVQYPGAAPASDRGGARLPFPRLRRHRLASRDCAASPARSAKRNARPSASSSRRARTRSRTPSASRRSIPAVFDIDISVCMSCQICVEVCPFDAIKMDVVVRSAHRRPLWRTAAGQAAVGKIQRVLPRIHPTEAAGADAGSCRVGARWAGSQGQGTCGVRTAAYSRSATRSGSSGKGPAEESK